MDLFDYMRENTMKKESPLASRLRPRTLDEVVGQQHIIGISTVQIIRSCKSITDYLQILFLYVVLIKSIINFSLFCR